MALETGTFISDLNDNNPAPGDPKAQGDDHIRLIKEALLASLPNIKGPMTVAHDQVASKNDIAQAQLTATLGDKPVGAGPFRLTIVDGQYTWILDSLFTNPARLAESHAVSLYF